MAPPPALGRRKTAVCFERTRVAHQQVVEIDEAAPALFVLVTGVKRGDGLGVRRQLPDAPQRLAAANVAGSTSRALPHSIWPASSTMLTSDRPGRPATSSARSLPLRSSKAGSGVRRSAHHRRNWLSAREWKVPAVTALAGARPFRRSRSSPAALRVKVIASTCSGRAAPVTTR